MDGFFFLLFRVFFFIWQIWTWISDCTVFVWMWLCSLIIWKEETDEELKLIAFNLTFVSIAFEMNEIFSISIHTLSYFLCSFFKTHNNFLIIFIQQHNRFSLWAQGITFSAFFFHRHCYQMNKYLLSVCNQSKFYFTSIFNVHFI